MEFLINIDLHFVYLLIFTLGLSFGTGAALLGNILFYTASKDGRVSKSELSMLKVVQATIWLGILLYAIGGVGLFYLAYDSMVQLDIFYATMIIVGVLVINLSVASFRHIPRLERNINGEEDNGKTPCSIDVLTGGVISIVSWVFLNLHHSVYRSEVSFLTFIIMYALVLAVGVFGVRYLFNQKNKAKNHLDKNRSIVVTVALVTSLFIVASVLSISIVGSRDDGNVRDTNESFVSFTLEDVAKHNNIKDCYVVIDDAVFDATTAAERYPEIYSCGEDVTEKYREVTPEGISDRMMKYFLGYIGYSMEEVVSHNENSSCWFVIDEFVFDATKEAKLHPAAFNCGTDVSINYHKNHGSGISDKMMRYKIGKLSDGGDIENIESNSKEGSALNPYTTLEAKVGSWDTENLMAIVEKDAEKLLFIDGSTHKEVGRIHDIGFQPHTSVFSPDGKYMYIIARDGWLTKINLETLEAVKSISVGINSRGTALTDNGRYLAIGNYEPGNVVIVDPVTMDILKTIDLVGKLDGEKVESRAGAMVEYGDKIIVALKDLNSVWVIDTSKRGFPVIEKNWNIGENQTPLHDAFLTPDGKFYIVASMGSDTVWVMNTETWEEIAEVKTGDTPHTGPGATWGGKIYVPALGEGLITVIDISTWEPIKYIKTSGPGLFIRAFNEDPSYPYVWAETAFGDYNDEIYVIDARIDEIVKTIIPVKGESSWHPEFTNDGKFVYIVSQTANEVEVYDAYTFEIVKRFEANTPSAVSNVGNRIEELGL